jgi:thymidylate synthase (FAD)
VKSSPALSAYSPLKIEPMTSVGLVWITPGAENVISYCARVSNPQNQDNYDTAPGLLKYCIKNRHWSIFEMATMCLEINTTRAISAQVIRHRSFSFQEMSTRYQDVSVLGGSVMPHLRRQDNKNRQNSIDDLDTESVQGYYRRISTLFEEAEHLYKEMVSDGVAKECARNILPLATPTRLYMNGSIRSWITYIALREKHGTQREHMMIAKDAKKLFCAQMPIIADALGGEAADWEI